MYKFLSFIFILMGILLILLSQATVSTDGTIALATGEVSAVTSVLSNAGTSMLTIFMQFWPAILIIGIIVGIIGYVMSHLGTKTK